MLSGPVLTRSWHPQCGALKNHLNESDGPRNGRFGQAIFRGLAWFAWHMAADTVAKACAHFDLFRRAGQSFIRILPGLKTVLPHADFVIEGYVDPREPLRDEDPFDGHTGYDTFVGTARIVGARLSPAVPSRRSGLVIRTAALRCFRLPRLSSQRICVLSRLSP